tara:strand:+ start:232 stop:876 length:645 start_codon:yes stop_codon:yes gene_type:complete
MDEEISIINNETRKEKIVNFFLNNKKKLISIIIIIIIIPVAFFSYQTYLSDQKKRLADRYNSAIINYNNGNNLEVISIMKKIVEDKDKTYSPLALYFLIDNNIIPENKEINRLFNILIKETDLEKEIKNLLIYKKGLLNSDFTTENELIEILNPVINSDSIWKSHSLHLIAEFFYFKGEKNKAKEFYTEITTLKNSNPNILNKARQRLIRDLSE